jgi:hypothetical protein
MKDQDYQLLTDIAVKRLEDLNECFWTLNSHLSDISEHLKESIEAQKQIKNAIKALDFTMSVK